VGPVATKDMRNIHYYSELCELERALIVGEVYSCNSQRLSQVKVNNYFIIHYFTANIYNLP
jgi:hypothetical protein